MKKKTALLNKAEEYVFTLMKEKLSPSFLYHNFNHTVSVVDTCREIAENLEMEDDETELIMLAAWFHDTGYTIAKENHEEHSKKIAEEFLAENKYPDEKTHLVKGAIDATRYPYKPVSLIDEIICDADLSHLGRKSYWTKNQFFRNEEELVSGNTFSDEEWYLKEIEFFKGNKFFTAYGQKEWSKQKTRNLLRLNELLLNSREQDKKKKLKEEQKLKTAELRETRSERGIETMFRVTMKNQTQLSMMADQKANIMISINALILTVLLSGFLTRFQEQYYLVIPVMTLAIVCVVTIICATLSTRPKITEGKFTKEDIENKRANLLFFGNFYRMPMEDFEWGFNEMMNDRNYLYSNLTRDIYFAGRVLGRKYNLLRKTYTIFMFGIIVAVIAYIVSYSIYLQNVQ